MIINLFYQNLCLNLKKLMLIIIIMKSKVQIRFHKLYKMNKKLINNLIKWINNNNNKHYHSLNNNLK